MAVSDVYDPERVRAVACPTCGAGEGESCVMSSGEKRPKHDYHANRKGVIYPKFVTRRRGLANPTKRAEKIVKAIDDYLIMRERGMHGEGYYGARQELIQAIKDIIIK